ncbi:MAG: urea ABC transporter permease subunit UrtB [Hyphomicrobiales bacterium]|nr:urea ABC transporter permease subunit UrtB [Hyphomicrobiales bacterium]
MRSVFARVFLTLSLVLMLAPARAADVDLKSALSGFLADSFPSTQKAIEAVVQSGSSQAPAIIEALQDERLYFARDAQLVAYKTKGGELREAATGGPVATTPQDLKQVRLNNRLRGIVNAAVGALTLMSSNPERRREAANAVFKSRDASTLPTLDSAIAKETDPATRTALEQARASVILAKSDSSDAQKIDAIGVLRARGDQDALAMLSAVAAGPETLEKSAAQAAAAAIETRLALWRNLQNVWYGLSLGSVLLLAAIGLAITFGVMGIINMAHGEMVMLGAYTTFVVQEYCRTSAPGLFNYSLFIAIPLAFLVTGAVGVVIERSIIRFLYGRPLETLLATFGVSLLLQQAVRTIFGANNREVGAPSFMSGAFHLGGLEITYGRMWIIVFALVVFAALQLLLRFTSFGLRMRAVTQNRRMASSMGIDTNRIDALAFGLGSGIAGMAGVALSQIDNVSPNLGQSYIIDSFMVVVFGGVGNLWGTFLGAALLGVANKFLEPFAGAVLGKIALLVFIILFIQKRPRGLFALKGRAVEA